MKGPRKPSRSPRSTRLAQQRYDDQDITHDGETPESSRGRATAGDDVSAVDAAAAGAVRPSGLHYFAEGLRVWVKNPYDEGDSSYRASWLPSDLCTRPPWVPAVVRSRPSGSMHVQAETLLAPAITVHGGAEEFWITNSTTRASNLNALTHAHEPALVFNSIARFNDGDIYTLAGDVLIALNPYEEPTKDGESIYSERVMQRYRLDAKRAVPKEPPHVWQVASRAYASLLEDHVSQSVVISGESGAGKTETAKLLLRYFASSSASRAGEDVGAASSVWSSGSTAESWMRGIERVLLQSNRILEAFGNAKTVRNHNSSRFGKYVNMEFSAQGVMTGCTVTPYLLEKSRVVGQMPDERNFHVFYQLLAGASADDRRRLSLVDAAENNYLLQRPSTTEGGGAAQPECTIRAGEIDDKEEYTLLRVAMDACGFERLDVSGVFRIVAGILQLGNVTFKPTSPTDETLKPRQPGVVKKAAKLLGISEEGLLDVLLFRHVAAGGRSSSAAAPLDLQAAEAARDAVAKAAYSSMFTWLVSAVNKRLAYLGSGGDETLDTPTNKSGKLGIGVLDIFGFEVFDVNTFEQLCINYANEKLHGFFVHHVFRMEMALYKSEGIDVSSITFTDNREIIGLIEDRPLGVLALLDEACLFPRSTDKSFAMKLDAALKRNPYFSPTGRGSGAAEGRRSSVSAYAAAAREAGGFTIHHFATDVTYAAGGFLEKNKDKLPDAMASLLRASEVRMLSTGLPGEATKSDDGGSAAGGAGGTRMTGSAAFLGSKFKDDMNRLLRRLSETHPHFVRCVKPNGQKLPGFIDAELLTSQFRYLGILDGIRIYHEGFPNRFGYSEFYERYVILEPSFVQRHGLMAPGGDLHSTCADLLEALWDTVLDRRLRTRPTDQLRQFGTSRVFLKRELYSNLEEKRAAKLSTMDAAALKIQSRYRTHYNAVTFRQVRRGVLGIQSRFRARRPRREFTQQRCAATTVKRFYLTKKQRHHFEEMRGAAAVIQDEWRKFDAMNALTRRRVTLLAVHTLARSLLLRKRLLRRMESLATLQRFARDFIVPNRTYWARVHAALLLQALWRGYCVRHFRPDIVEFLNEFRRRRARDRFFLRVFAMWRGKLVRERYLIMRGAARHLQAWVRTHLLWRFLRRGRRAATVIQAQARGRMARRKVGELLAAKVADEEVEEINQISRREVAAIAGMSARMQDNAYTRKLGGVTDEFHHLADVDILVDNREVYPRGWAKQVLDREAECVQAGVHTADLSVGSTHSVLVTTQGKTYSWGWGDRGQLGHSGVTELPRPRTIDSLFQRSGGTSSRVQRGWGANRIVTKVAAGADHTLALTASGKVYSWGANARGQLGLGHSRPVATPTLVDTIARKVSEVAAGAYHSVILTGFGSVYTMGAGDCCGLGSDSSGSREGKVTHADVYTPQGLKSLSRFTMKHISCGWRHSLALSSTGDMFSWGSNEHGQLGLGSTKQRLMPALIVPPKAPEPGLDESDDLGDLSAYDLPPGSPGARAARTVGGGAGGEVSAAMIASRRASATYAGLDGVLAAPLPGDAGMDVKLDLESTVGSEATSLQVGNQKPYNVAEIRCGANHNVVLSITGRVYTWGANRSGQLGTGDTLPRHYPTRVGGALRHKRGVSVAAGWRNSAVLTKDHEIFCWGRVGAKWSHDRAQAALRLHHAHERAARRSDSQAMAADVAEDEGRFEAADLVDALERAERGEESKAGAPADDAATFVSSQREDKHVEPLDEIERSMPRQLLMPAAFRVRGCEGFLPLRLACSWSSSMSALSVFYRGDKSTGALVAATEAKVSKVRALLEHIGDDAHLSDLEDSDEDDKILSIKALKEAEDYTGATASTGASAALMKERREKARRIKEQQAKERVIKAKLEKRKKLTAKRWAELTPRQRLEELGITDAKMRLMDPSSLNALRATIRSGRPNALKAARMVAENLDRRATGRHAVYQNPGGMSDEEYRRAVASKEGAWLANTQNSAHRVLKRGEADRLVARGEAERERMRTARTAGGISTKGMPALSYTTQLLGNPLSATDERAAQTALSMARTAKELTGFDAPKRHRRKRGGADTGSVTTHGTTHSLYSRAVRMVERGAVADIQEAFEALEGGGDGASVGSDDIHAAGLGNAYHNVIGASSDMYRKLLVAGGDYDEWERAAEEAAAQDKLAVKHEIVAAKAAQREAEAQAARERARSAGRVSISAQFSPELLVTTHNEDLKIDEVRRRREQREKERREQEEAARIAAEASLRRQQAASHDPVELYRKHGAHQEAAVAVSPLEDRKVRARVDRRRSLALHRERGNFAPRDSIAVARAVKHTPIKTVGRYGGLHKDALDIVRGVGGEQHAERLWDAEGMATPASPAGLRKSKPPPPPRASPGY